MGKRADKAVDKKVAAVGPIALTPLEMFAIRTLCGDSKCEKVRDRLVERNGQVVDFTVRFSGAVNVAAGATSRGVEGPSNKELLAILLASIHPRTRKDVCARVAEFYAGFRNGDEAPEVKTADLAAAEDLVASVSRDKEVFRRGNVTGAVSALVVERK